MALHHMVKFQFLFSPVKEDKFNAIPPFAGIATLPKAKGNSFEVPFSRMGHVGLSPNILKQGGGVRRGGVHASKTARRPRSDDGKKMRREEYTDSDEEDDEDNFSANKGVQNDPYLMDPEERREWRRKIREVISNCPNVEEAADSDEKRIKMEKLLADYPLVKEDEDPDWPEEDDEGWGFKLGQFFNKISIKNVKKDDDDDENYDSEDEIIWEDDNYIRPIKDITTAEWEETVFKDISPLIVLVHNRYSRPKENEKVRAELDKAVNIIWNCRLPSPRCVAIDAIVECDLVSALQVSVFPELIFIKAGKILYREKTIRSADELSKIMAFFYYGAAKPPCLNGIGHGQETVPACPVNSDTVIVEPQ